MDQKIQLRNTDYLQNLSVIYYMPVVFENMNTLVNNSIKYKNFYEFCKCISHNACVIDRTLNSTKTPFNFKVLDPIPKISSNKKTFRDVSLERAKELLNKNKQIRVLYSGGLDSTVILLSLYECIKNGIGSFDQVIVSCNSNSIIENPDCWKHYVLPNFELEEIGTTFKNTSIENVYVMGENADQLFGSETILHNLESLNQNLNIDNIALFLKKKNVSEEFHSHFFEVYENLIKSCPLELKKLSDLFWWINFSCRWQADIFTTFCFTSLFDNPVNLKLFEDNFRSFYNTDDFQNISLNNNLEKWSIIPHPLNYKLDIRNYVKTFKELSSWADNKSKFPSLYKALAPERAIHKVLVTDNKQIYSLNNSESLNFFKNYE
jgi:hypothetical protein